MSLNKISERIFLLNHEERTDRPTLGYIRGDRYSLAVDAGNSEMHVEKFYRCLSLNSLRLPDYTALTHYHWDHTFGMHAVSGKTVCCCLTDEKLLEMTGWKWDEGSVEERIQEGLDIASCRDHIRLEYPNHSKIKVITGDVVFRDRLTLDLGGVHCILMQVIAPHTDDSVLIYVPEERAVFVGDADCGDINNNNGNYDKDKLTAYIKVLDSLVYDKYIIGHGDLESEETALAYLTGELSKL